MTILNEIIANKKEEVDQAKKEVSLGELRDKLNNFDYQPKVLQKNLNKLVLIAEVKKKSPSKGIIRKDFDYVQIAEDFANSGASAISVLTDEKYFGGSKKFFAEIREKVDLPLLRKDFIVDEYQIYETKLMKADLILLIVMALGEELEKFLKISLELGLQPLIEIHDEKELNQTLEVIHKLSTAYQQKVILGINNRDLRTFVTNIQVGLDLVKQIPSKLTKISESGLNTLQDLEKAENGGFDGVLIGEGLAKNPEMLGYWK